MARAVFSFPFSLSKGGGEKVSESLKTTGNGLKSQGPPGLR